MHQQPPKCECGTTIGLSVHADRWWCPDCLWEEIERLRRMLDKHPKTHDDWPIYVGMEVFPSTNEEGRVLGPWKVVEIHSYCVLVRQAKGIVMGRPFGELYVSLGVALEAVESKEG